VLELTITAPPAATEPLPDWVPEAPSEHPSALDLTRTIEVADRPLVEAGVFRSEALFSGVPTLMRDLAPATLGSRPGARSGAAGGSRLALVDELLAPRALGADPTATQAEAAEAPPEEPESDRDNAAEGLSGERRKQISDAALDLHKPLRTIALTGHLAKQMPSNLAAEVHSLCEPLVVWGEPWPASCLACYRYTVPFHHRPLYFEQPNLERCGHHDGILSPYTSAAHFFGNVVLLPLHLVLEPPCQCVPTLGDCRGCQSYSKLPLGYLFE